MLYSVLLVLISDLSILLHTIIIWLHKYESFNLHWKDQCSYSMTFAVWSYKVHYFVMRVERTSLNPRPG